MQFKNQEIKAIAFDENGYPCGVLVEDEAWQVCFSRHNNVLLVRPSEDIQSVVADFKTETASWLLDKDFEGIAENIIDTPPIHQDILQAMLDKSWDVEDWVYCDVCDSYFSDGENTTDCGHLIWIDDEYEWGGIGGELRPQDIKPKMQIFLKELGVKGSINLLEDLIFHLPQKYITEDKLHQIWEANEHSDFKTLTNVDSENFGDTKHCLAWIKSLSAEGWETSPKAIALRNTTVNWIYEFLVQYL